MFQNKNSASVRANSLFEGVEKYFKININQKDFVEKKEGDIIYQNGDPADYLYLILEGEVKQKISGIFTSPVVVKSSKDEFFGEKEVIENNTRSSSAVANTDCLLYRFDRNSIINIAGQNKTIKKNLYKSLQIDEPGDMQQNSEAQKAFFISTDDSTKKFTIPAEKPAKKERVEILDEDIADRDNTEPVSGDIQKEEDYHPEIIPVENLPAENEAVADEFPVITEDDASINNIDDSSMSFTDNEPDNSENNFSFSPDVIPENNTEEYSDPVNPPYLTDSIPSQDDAPLTDTSNADDNISSLTLETPDGTQEDLSLTDIPVAEEKKEEEISSGNTGDFTAQEVAGLISNDIIYPINTLRFYADQIKKREISPELNSVVNLLIEQANIIHDFIDIVFDYTEGRDSLNIDLVNLNQVLDEVLGLLADYIESRSSVLYKKYESVSEVLLDKRKFFHVIYQSAKLLSQAVPAGGNIYVVLSSDDKNALIEMKCTSADNQKENIIREVSYIENAGMGYMIAEQIIKGHGGSMKFSGDDNSAVITILIPLNR